MTDLTKLTGGALVNAVGVSGVERLAVLSEIRARLERLEKCEAIVTKLQEMRKHYDDDDWSLEDLRNDLEEIFMELTARAALENR